MTAKKAVTKLREVIYGRKNKRVSLVGRIGTLFVKKQKLTEEKER